jgi:hypothetical protein
MIPTSQPLKINRETKRLAVRSNASTTESLRTAVELLYKNRLDNPRWSSCGFDGRERTPDEQSTLVDFHPLHLSSMRHFRVSPKNEGIWQIQASSGGGFSLDLLESTAERFPRLDVRKTKSAYITCHVESLDVSGPDEIDEFFIEFGWRTQSGPPGHFIRHHSSNPRSSVSARFAFISSAITHLSLNDAVQLEGNESEFTVTAAPGWSLYEFETWSDKRNPSFFRIGPFPSFDDVWQRAERFCAGPLGKQVSRLAVSFVASPDVYETIYEQLNELANEWKVGLYGNYADGIDPYTADASQSPDGRFPVFVWSPARDARRLFYQADIVPTADARFLEIHSNCGDMKKLLKEAEAATGMKCTPLKESMAP